MAPRMVTFNSLESANRWLDENTLTLSDECSGHGMFCPTYYIHDQDGNIVGEYLKPSPVERTSVGKPWLIMSAVFDDARLRLPLEYRN